MREWTRKLPGARHSCTPCVPSCVRPAAHMLVSHNVVVSRTCVVIPPLTHGGGVKMLRPIRVRTQQRRRPGGARSGRRPKTTFLVCVIVIHLMFLHWRVRPAAHMLVPHNAMSRTCVVIPALTHGGQIVQTHSCAHAEEEKAQQRQKAKEKAKEAKDNLSGVRHSCTPYVSSCVCPAAHMLVPHNAMSRTCVVIPALTHGGQIVQTHSCAHAAEEKAEYLEKKRKAAKVYRESFKPMRSCRVRVKFVGADLDCVPCISSSVHSPYHPDAEFTRAPSSQVLVLSD